MVAGMGKVVLERVSRLSSGLREERGGEERPRQEEIVVRRLFSFYSCSHFRTLSTISFSCCCWMSFCCASALRWASKNKKKRKREDRKREGSVIVSNGFLRSIERFFFHLGLFRSSSSPSCSCFIFSTSRR